MHPTLPVAYHFILWLSWFFPLEFVLRTEIWLGLAQRGC